MKVSTFAFLVLPAATLAVPAPTKWKHSVVLVQRAASAASASIQDVPKIGYATLNGGTTGGGSANTTTVSTLAELTAAVADNTPRVVIVSGPITGTGSVRVGSHKTIVGKNGNAKLTGINLTIKSVSNVIVRNLAIYKVVGNDAITIQKATNIWIDHLDLSSDRSHDKDYYDGLLDITHAGDFITVSNTFFHDHWKGSLIGHSSSNGAEDTGHLRVTYYNNHWLNINSRGPSIRFGTSHIFNNYYDTVNDGINTRDGAQVLVENNVFVNSKKPLYSTDNGYAVEKGNDFGGAKNAALAGSLNSVPYQYTLLSAAQVKSAVVGTAGATLTF